MLRFGCSFSLQLIFEFISFFYFSTRRDHPYFLFRSVLLFPSLPPPSAPFVFLMELYSYLAQSVEPEWFASIELWNKYQIDSDVRLISPKCKLA